jgi:hypothetical protein
MSTAQESGRIELGKLTHLLLGNFKAFKRTQRIPIRPITLIYGRNNSGKSSIIQALLYAEQVRRTGELTPETILKDGKTVLDGGWSRLVHGRGKDKMIEFGWEWSNPGSAAGLKSGRIWHRVEDNGWEFKAELNGEEFLDWSVEDWGNPLLNNEHPAFVTAVAAVQKWFAQEFREHMESDYASDELRAVLSEIAPRLEAGDFAKGILSELLDGSACLQIDALGLPCRFKYVSPIEYDIGSRFGLSRSVSLGVEATAGFINGCADRGDALLRDWGLRNDLYSHVCNFIAERGSYLLYRWFKDVWRHFDGSPNSLMGTTHYLGAVRTRPDRVVFRMPRDLSSLSKDRHQRFAPQHPDWILQPETVKKANRWLKKHQALTANIELRYAEMKSRKRRGAATQATSAAESASTLWLHDLDRGVDLNFNEAGYGLSQFIPVLLACFAEQDHYADKPVGTLLIEEPEGHVHPALQAEIGTLFADAVARRKRPLAHIICETHSEHLLLRIMRRIREGKLSADKVSVLYVENLGKESIVREMPLNERGELVNDWPGGFFEEGLRELLI